MELPVGSLREYNTACPRGLALSQIWNTKQERVTHNVDEECFMIFSWTHHVVELECQQKDKTP